MRVSFKWTATTFVTVLGMVATLFMMAPASPAAAASSGSYQEMCYTYAPAAGLPDPYVSAFVTVTKSGGAVKSIKVDPSSHARVKNGTWAWVYRSSSDKSPVQVTFPGSTKRGAPVTKTTNIQVASSAKVYVKVWFTDIATAVPGVKASDTWCAVVVYLN